MQSSVHCSRRFFRVRPQIAADGVLMVGDPPWRMIERSRVRSLCNGRVSRHVPPGVTMQKTILITGCSSGIGAALAAEFGRRGHRVYATARRSETLASLERDGIRGLKLDVNDDTSIAGAFETVAAEAGHLDLLVNNAGFSQVGAVIDLTRDDLRRQYETNVIAPVAVTAQGRAVAAIGGCEEWQRGRRKRRQHRRPVHDAICGRVLLEQGGRAFAHRRAADGAGAVRHPRRIDPAGWHTLELRRSRGGGYSPSREVALQGRRAWHTRPRTGRSARCHAGGAVCRAGR